MFHRTTRGSAARTREKTGSPRERSLCHAAHEFYNAVRIDADAAVFVVVADRYAGVRAHEFRRKITAAIRMKSYARVR